MNGGKRVFLTCALVIMICASVQAQKGRWASADDPIVKQITAKEKMWLDADCGPQPGLAEVFADDFQGTAVDGQRYGKDHATQPENPPHRDCQLGEVKVQFFGDSVAVAYGSESSMVSKNGTESKRCLVWTDTWLKRQGKWQIVAAQDNAVPCS